MMTSDDKVGGWVKKGQNHDDVILEWSLIMIILFNIIFQFPKMSKLIKLVLNKGRPFPKLAYLFHMYAQKHHLMHYGNIF